MDVSIIFVNYKTINLLANSIASVLTETKDISYEIIVVDNASGDDSRALLFEKFNNKVKYVSLPDNIGFGRANNEGIKIANGRNVFLLNPDTLLLNNAVKILSDYLDDNSEIGVVGANLYNEDKSFQPSFSHNYPSLGFEVSNLFHALFLFNRENVNSTKNPKIVKSVVGAAMMIKQSVIDKTGAFDPRFFMYAEEEEWCLRIRKSGHKIANVPEASILHLDGKSFDFSADRQKRRLEGVRTLYRISYSPFYCRILRVVEYLTIISRLAVSKILRNHAKIDFWSFMYDNRKWE